MYCRSCGATNDDNAFKCVNCGEGLQEEASVAPVQNVANHLVAAILVTILCCWPLGIPAIVFAAKVNGFVGAGDYGGAMEASKKASMWIWIAFGLGLPLQIIAIILQIIAFAGGMAGGMEGY